MQKHPHIAIVILNWNGLEDSKECLQSVFKNDYSKYSVYVVDNASENDDLAALKSFCKQQLSKHQHPPQVHYLQNSSNLGFAGGNNEAIKQALKKNVDFIFLLNNDTEVDPHFLTAAFAATADTKVGIVAPSMINYYHRSKLDNIGHQLLTTGDTVPRGRNKAPSRMKHSNKHPMGACAGAALYSAPMLKKIGLLDNAFFLNYEDSDLSLRGIVQGWQCVWAPESKVYHKINASIKKVKNSSYRIRSQRNQLWAYLHNTPLPVVLLNSPWIILRDLLVFLLSIMTFRWTITKIFVCSRWEVLKSLPRILKKRRKVLQHQRVSSWWFWRNQTSWLSTYWQYFQDIVIKRKESVMETGN